MARLILPAFGTVVHLEGDLEDAYRAKGWVDANAFDPAAEVAPDEPQEEVPEEGPSEEAIDPMPSSDEQPVKRGQTRRTNK